VKEHLHIVIAEPSDVVRRGLGDILTGDAAIPVTFTEVDSVESLRQTIVKTRPDVVIVNPVYGALVTPATIRREFPFTRTVMLSFLPADTVTARLWDDVITVWDSAQTIRERVLRQFPSAERVVAHQLEPLSEREKEVVACVAGGMTNKQTAARLHLSHHTVSTHRRNISAKLGIHTTSGLVAWAIASKLVNVDAM
jgi:DNA-binding NarL/FixJ family response regulator